LALRKTAGHCGGEEQEFDGWFHDVIFWLWIFLVMFGEWLIEVEVWFDWKHIPQTGEEVCW